MPATFDGKPALLIANDHPLLRVASLAPAPLHDADLAACTAIFDKPGVRNRTQAGLLLARSI